MGVVAGAQCHYVAMLAPSGGAHVLGRRAEVAGHLPHADLPWLNVLSRHIVAAATHIRLWVYSPRALTCFPELWLTSASP